MRMRHQFMVTPVFGTPSVESIKVIGHEATLLLPWLQHEIRELRRLIMEQWRPQVEAFREECERFGETQDALGVVQKYIDDAP